MREETRAHYDRLASVYDQNWAYSQDFLEWMSGCILARLRVNHGASTGGPDGVCGVR